MIPRPFDYVAVASIDEAVELLASTENARVMAGGMSLIPMMKLRLVAPSTLVDIARIPDTDTLAVSDDHLCVGPTATQRALVHHRAIAADATALAEAASWTGDPQVRNRGTLCGSVAHADPSADQPAAVLALDGRIELRSVRGSRSVPAHTFFTDAFATAMEPDEMVTAVLLPLPIGAEGSAYEKLGRRGGRSGFAIVGSAAWVRMSDGRVTDARVALTAVSHRPTLIPKVADRLTGSDGSDGAIRSAVADITAEVDIVPDLHGSAPYKAHLAGVLTERALATAIARARPPRS